MKLLVTAGNTLVPIDKVRCITNVFTGRTGAAVAVEAHRRGHDVTLLTSHPEAVRDLFGLAVNPVLEHLHVHTFLTFDNLRELMAERVQAGNMDAVIHCAAVSDYHASGIFAAAAGTEFSLAEGVWHGQPPRLEDRSAGKVKSDESELWLRLVRTPKLVDYIRRDWRFAGVLVKFKLEVGVSDERLLEIAERSRVQSGADLLVANTLEGASSWAYLGPLEQGYVRVNRRALAGTLVMAVEARCKEHKRG